MDVTVTPVDGRFPGPSGRRSIEPERDQIRGSLPGRAFDLGGGEDGTLYSGGLGQATARGQHGLLAMTRSHHRIEYTLEHSSDSMILGTDRPSFETGSNPVIDLGGFDSATGCPPCRQPAVPPHRARSVSRPAICLRRLFAKVWRRHHPARVRIEIAGHIVTTRQGSQRSPLAARAWHYAAPCGVSRRYLLQEMANKWHQGRRQWCSPSQPS